MGSGAKIALGAMTAGLSLRATGISGKKGTEMMPLKAITGVTTKKDGLRFTLVNVASAGSTIGFRVGHGEAAELSRLLTELMLAGPASAMSVRQSSRSHRRMTANNSAASPSSQGRSPHRRRVRCEEGPDPGTLTPSSSKVACTRGRPSRSDIVRCIVRHRPGTSTICHGLAEVAALLNHEMRSAVVTRAEEGHLRAAGLGGTTPDRTDPWARYQQAGTTLRAYPQDLP